MALTEKQEEDIIEEHANMLENILLDEGECWG